MNTSNIKNFARYDLTINKTFYRNMVIMAISLGMGISALAFAGRMLMYNTAQKAYEFVGDISPDDDSHFSNTTITNVFLSILLSFLPIIFAGCTFHSFRRKQGRITELTLPATNKEKYLWHVIVSVGGGLMATLLALLSADLLNFLMHLAVYGTDYTYSLTARMWEIFTLSTAEFDAIKLAEEATNGYPIYSFITALRLLVICSFFANICIHIYGNSIKYHYNIIITYGITLLASLIITFGIAGIFAATHSGSIYTSDMTPEEMKAQSISNMNETICWLYAIVAFLVITGVICIWRSIKRYNNAQVTSINNK